jgi:hypothetical protein
MKIKKIKSRHTVSLDLQSKPSRFVIETAKTDPKLPALFAFCGSRGSGKTYACVAMCSHFEKMGYITRTFLICPTKASNYIYQQPGNPRREQGRVRSGIPLPISIEEHRQRGEKGLARLRFRETVCEIVS